jgi:hypothetical protein
LKRAKKRPLPSAELYSMLSHHLKCGARSKISGSGDAKYFASLRALANRMRILTAGVEVDLDAYLDPADD